jgi:putative membrane protein
MRQQRELPHSWLLIGMTIIVASAAAVFSVLILLAG